MRPITSAGDFEEVLDAERAVIFVFFAWSEQAGLSRRTVEQWETELASAPGKMTFPICQLAPDSQPFTWKWVNAALDGASSGEDAHGLVLWLRKGSIIGRVQNAAVAGVKSLNAMTGDCFGSEPGQAATGSVSVARGSRGFDVELLSMICCPETHQELKPASSSLLETLHQLMKAGRLKNRAGRLLDEQFEGGLVRADGRYLYPLHRGIPILLVDEAIPLQQGKGAPHAGL
jgi:uncharacterized protein YbaR (Trm112 family)